MNNFTLKRRAYSLRFIVVALFFLSHLSALHAVPAYPYPIQVTQPDGSTLTLYLRGDEFFNYRITLDGYLVTQDKEGYYKYATWNEDGLITETSVRVSDINARTDKEKQLLTELKAYPDFSQVNLENRMRRVGARNHTDQPMRFPTKDNPKSLVILVEYQDVEFITPEPQKAFNALLNQQGYSENGATGSARDYFENSSNGQFVPEFVVVGPYKLSKNRASYGGEDDRNAANMIVEACELAHAAGVDFSEFDTDNDGYVDNVFVYYAGINQAESMVVETVWPHRWYLTGSGGANITLILDEVQVNDYACTSEISGIQGSTRMCGIGTFVHEFGHVLGLPDFYSTGTSQHVTLEEWSVMDYGPYLNEGRTPPAYSAYERFFVGWMEPLLIKEKGFLELEALSASNEAYIVTQSGEHNLEGGNPEPKEFFMVENRQNKGWDTYLPGHGMLITRIVYNANAWNNNTVNNSSNRMGYELIRADGTNSAVTSDANTFPGSAKIREYTLVSRDTKEDIGRPITDIIEIEDKIYFNFMGEELEGAEINGEKIGMIVEKEVRPFYSVYGNEKDVQQIKVAVIGENADIRFSLGDSKAYEVKKETDETDEWYKTLDLSAENYFLGDETILIRYNLEEDTESEEYLIIEKDGVEEERIPLSGYFVDLPVLEKPSEVSLEGFTVNWKEVDHASGYYLTVASVEEGESTSFIEGFDKGVDGTPYDWTLNVTGIAINYGNYGRSFPSLAMYDGDYIQTEEYLLAPTTISLYVVGLYSVNGKLIFEGWNKENGWKEIATEVPTGRKTLRYDLEEDYYRFRVTYTGNQFIYVDDFTATFFGKVEYITKNAWTEDTSYTLSELDPELEYLYRVKANRILVNDGFLLSEYVTPFSISASVIPVGIEEVQISDKTLLQQALESGLPIRIFSITGQQVALVNSIEGLERLTKGQIYILQSGNLRFKLAL